MMLTDSIAQFPHIRNKFVSRSGLPNNLVSQRYKTLRNNRRKSPVFITSRPHPYLRSPGAHGGVFPDPYDLLRSPSGNIFFDDLMISSGNENESLRLFKKKGRVIFLTGLPSGGRGSR